MVPNVVDLGKQSRLRPVHCKFYFCSVTYEALLTPCEMQWSQYHQTDSTEA